MTEANRVHDGVTLRDVCIMAKEMWLADQQLDDMLIDWEQLNDLVHQTVAVSAAMKVGLEKKAWRDLLDRYRRPGETMLQMCRQAQAGTI